MAGKKNNQKKPPLASKPETGKPTPAKKAKKSGSPVKIAWWQPIVIVIVTLLLYARSIDYQFVKMDDADLIVENQVFLKNMKNLPKAFQQSAFEVPGQLTDNKSYYRPVLIISLMLDTRIKSKNPAKPYHVFNLIYHLLACLLLFYLLKKLTKNPDLSFVLALIFAVHPVNTHAVAWVLGRNDPLLAIFTLLSFHGLIDYYRTNKTRFLVLHLVAYAFALFSKESGVLLLVLYFLFMLLWIKDIKFFLKKIALPVSYAAITVLWFLARYQVMHGHEDIGGQGSILDVVMKNAGYLFLYIGKILLPFNLNVMPGVDSTAIILGIFSLIGLGALFYFIPDRLKALFSVSWFFMLILPTLLVPELPAYEHRDYLALIGLLMGISQVSFLVKYKVKAGPLTYAFGGIVVLFIILTSIRLPVFENAFTFWEDPTENTPFISSGCINMGHLYQEVFENIKDNPNPQAKSEAKKDLEKAGEWYRKGLKADSTTLHGNNNYGAYLYFNGRKDEAAQYFQREIKYHPTSSDPVKNMGIYYKEKGEPAKSVPYWKKLIAMNHYNMDAYEELAVYYKRLGDSTNAKYYAKTRQQIDDESFDKYHKLK